MIGYRKIGVWKNTMLYTKDGGGLLIERHFRHPNGSFRIALAFPFRGELNHIYEAAKCGQKGQPTVEEFMEYLNPEQCEALCLVRY